VSFKEITKILDESDAKLVVLLCHHNADPDAICSAYAFANLLKYLRPKAEVEIGAAQGISRLSRHLLKYLPIEVETQPNVEKADAIVLLDTNTIQQLNNLAEKVKTSKAPIIVIDHHAAHPETEQLAKLCITNEEASSTCEIVYNFFKEMDIKANENEAKALFLGITFDTRHFILANSSTLKTIAELIDAGVNAHETLPLLSLPIDFSERVARLKACRRAKLFKIGEWIIALSHVSAYQASAARAIIDIGAHVAAVAGQKNENIEISLRCTREFHEKTGIHLGKDVAKPLGGYLHGMGGGHCLSPNSLIILKNGEIKPLRDVKIGDKVASCNLTTLENSNSICTQRFRNGSYEEVLVIKTSYNFEIKASPDHRFFMLSNLDIVEKRAPELKVGDYVMGVEKLSVEGSPQRLPRVIDVYKAGLTKGHHIKNVRVPMLLTPEVARFLGYFVGDGSVYNHDVVELKEERKEVAEYYASLGESLFNCSAVISRVPKKSCWRTRFYSSVLGTFFERCKPMILELICKSEDNVVLEFLRGLTDAEGTVDPHGVSIATSDKNLMLKVQLLLLRLGVHGTLTKKHKQNYKEQCAISITGIDLSKFVEIINFRAADKRRKVKHIALKVKKIKTIPVKETALARIISETNSKHVNLRRTMHFAGRFLSLNDWMKTKLYVENQTLRRQVDGLFRFRWLKIRSINKEKNVNVMEDITTTEGNYITSGVVVHNSTAAGVNGVGDIETGLKYCLRLLKQKLVNQ
jgi:nanoRNase/pAp phosphatase (c-di-AMP/oligoRNAs hydrolase)/intein/homing endonuclease